MNSEQTKSKWEQEILKNKIMKVHQSNCWSHLIHYGLDI